MTLLLERQTMFLSQYICDSRFLSISWTLTFTKIFFFLVCILYAKTDTDQLLYQLSSKLKSNYGFRLVELRSDPEGVVFHHWEFLSETPPTDFTLKLSRLKNVPQDAKTVSILAEDNVGNVFKKKVQLEVFERWWRGLLQIL